MGPAAWLGEVQPVHSLSIFANERKSERSECEARGSGCGVGFTNEASKKIKIYLGIQPLPSQVFRFARAFSSLTILSAHSTIEYKYEKIEGCEQSKRGIQLKESLVVFEFQANSAGIGVVHVKRIVHIGYVSDLFRL